MRSPNLIYLACDFHHVNMYYNKGLYPFEYVSKEYMDAKIDKALELLCDIEINDIGLLDQDKFLNAIEVLEHEY